MPHEARAIALVRGRFRVPERPSTPPSTVIRDAATIRMSFNVMPDRNVTETLLCNEYRAWPGYVEATFDRFYQSEMEKSPSHLIVTTAQAHAQKLAYIAVAESFGRPYVPTEPEYFKIWWTCAYSTMPKMIRENENLQQCLWVIERVKTGPKSYAFEAYSRVSDMELWARAGIFLI